MRHHRSVCKIYFGFQKGSWWPLTAKEFAKPKVGLQRRNAMGPFKSLCEHSA